MNRLICLRTQQALFNILKITQVVALIFHFQDSNKKVQENILKLNHHRQLHNFKNNLHNNNFPAKYTITLNTICAPSY